MRLGRIKWFDGVIVGQTDIMEMAKKMAEQPDIDYMTTGDVVLYRDTECDEIDVLTRRFSIPLER